MLFTISGHLPAPWEDFMGAEHVTIAHDPEIYVAGYCKIEKCQDGYWDVFVKEDVTEPIAKNVLSIIMGCEPHEVEIKQTGVCQSV